MQDRMGSGFRIFKTRQDQDSGYSGLDGAGSESGFRIFRTGPDQDSGYSGPDRAGQDQDSGPHGAVEFRSQRSGLDQDQDSGLDRIRIRIQDRIRTE